MYHWCNPLLLIFITTETLHMHMYSIWFYIYLSDSSVYVGIEESLRDKYQKLRDHITYLKQKNRTESKTLDYETDIEVLVQQLADCKDIIDQQEQMIRVINSNYYRGLHIFPLFTTQTFFHSEKFNGNRRRSETPWCTGEGILILFWVMSSIAIKD